MKQIGTLLGLTALLGWGPALISIALAQFALAHGARDWAEPIFAVLFSVIYLALMGAGAWIYAHWFGR